jgi:hypothetical protein
MIRLRTLAEMPPIDASLVDDEAASALLASVRPKNDPLASSVDDGERLNDLLWGLILARQLLHCRALVVNS